MKYLNDRNRNTDTNEIDSRRKPLWYSGRYFDYPLLGIVRGLFCLDWSWFTAPVPTGQMNCMVTVHILQNDSHCLECFWYRRSIIADMQDIQIFSVCGNGTFSAGLHYRKCEPWIDQMDLYWCIWIPAVGICKACADRIYRRFCTRKPRSLNTLKGLAKMLLLPFVTIILIAIENLSTAIICFGIV